MESQNSCTINNGEEEILELLGEEQEQEQEDHHEEEKDYETLLLKRRISSHPLYQLLVQAHLQCLKVGDLSNLEGEQRIEETMKKEDLGIFNQSELDLFMEAYCLALGKLKEAMEEPQQKSMAFINNMHSQLRELTKSTTMHEPPATASSSTERKFGRNSSI